MPLSAGTQLGPYEILAPLGEGGMGEVYRARDTKLKRDVALKVLPEAFAHDPERMARFQREAEVLASLNHPNIAAIYGLAEGDGMQALVMELVEGESPKGPMVFDDAWKIVSQIAAALEYAHERGIMHRDLKPANVKITPEGVVKLLDFGLAKAFTNQRERSASPEDSPTLTLGATEVGVILGTAAYMAPEQARGKAVDKRADIWSFGVVLYELLTGERPFTGEDAAETLAAVIHKQPDFARAPAKAQRLLRRCLEKDPRRRLRDIGDAWELLEETPAQQEAAPATSRLRRWLWPSVNALCLLITGGVTGYFITRPAAPNLVTHFLIESPPDTIFTNQFAATAISPDGRFLVYGAAAGSAQPTLWLRSLDSLTARSLPGTEGANFPFWSTDNRSIAFFAGGKLKRVEIAGGAPLVLCDAPSLGSGSVGGAWSRDGVILLGAPDGLHRVPASGGLPLLLTKTDASQETGHGYPQFFPDGKRFLYFVESGNTNMQGIYSGSLDRPQDRVQILRTSAKALYAPPVAGHPGSLVWLREQTLLAQRFDAGNLRLEGDPVPLADDVSLGGGGNRAAFWVSEAGLLVYRTGVNVNKAKLVWIGRDGKRLGDAGPEDSYTSLRLSPDGKRVAIGRLDSTAQDDIWVLELGRGVFTRLTFDPKRDTSPVWSPDGRQIAFSSNRSGVLHVYRKDSGGAGQEEQLTSGPNGKTVSDWSPDGRYLLYAEFGQSNADIKVLPLEGERKPIAVVQTAFAETGGVFSLDGKWIAYQSNESGRQEIYVRAFSPAAPVAGGEWQVSNHGGTRPRWRGDGKELFYLVGSVAGNSTMMAAGIRTTAASVERDTPRELFTTSVNPNLSSPYDVTADGQRLLVEELSTTARPEALTVVTNWQAGLKK